MAARLPGSTFDPESPMERILRYMIDWDAYRTRSVHEPPDI
jgi:hypothetical protein